MTRKPVRSRILKHVIERVLRRGGQLSGALLILGTTGTVGAVEPAHLSDTSAVAITAKADGSTQPPVGQAQSAMTDGAAETGADWDNSWKQHWDNSWKQHGPPSEIREKAATPLKVSEADFNSEELAVLKMLNVL